MAAPVMVASWSFGSAACAAGGALLAASASALDAVEAGANVTELDPEVASVGYGGLPNAAGYVELDAAIMDGPSHGAGAVGAVRTVRTPISVARRVMECTPHVMLVGPNADAFARAQGFPEEELLTDAARRRWQEWRATAAAPDVAHFEPRPLTPVDHDTIALCALDAHGNLAAGCTTSGMAWKLPGRVGDSPIVGSGLYVDNAAGAAAATGHGDEMMKACVSYRAVLNMAAGQTAEEACKSALAYLELKRPAGRHGDYGAAIVAIRSDGDFGAAATSSGFRIPDREWQWSSWEAGTVSDHRGPYLGTGAQAPV